MRAQRREYRRVAAVVVMAIASVGVMRASRPSPNGPDAHTTLQAPTTLDGRDARTTLDGARATVEGDCTRPQLELQALDYCVAAGEQLIVRVELSGWLTCPDIIGGQFLLRYNQTKVELVSATPGDGSNPIDTEIYQLVDETLGTIDYVVSSSEPGRGITSGALATLTFDPLVQDCTADDLLSFRDHTPPTRLTDEDGVYYDVPDGTLTLADLPVTILDFTPPVITCPGDVTLAADTGSGCNSHDDAGTATATEYICGSAPTVTGVRSDGQPLEAPFCTADSPITITWTAEDECGNTSQCAQVVTVREIGELAAVVELQGWLAPGPFTRCITFELWDCDTDPPTVAAIRAELVFSGGVGSITVAIPPGDYECITARDELHTLARTDQDDFGIVGSQYVADFTDAPGHDEDALVGGNADGNAYIDIIDFGLWAANYGQTPGADTTCATPAPHPDFNGDGLVDELDFSFIQINFLEWDEPGCCGRAAAPDGYGRPRTRVSVMDLRALGYGALTRLDLNRDGWLDLTDVELWLAKSSPGGAARRKP